MLRGLCEICGRHDVFVYPVPLAFGRTVFVCAGCLNLPQATLEEDEDDDDEWELRQHRHNLMTLQRAYSAPTGLQDAAAILHCVWERRPDDPSSSGPWHLETRKSQRRSSSNHATRL